MRRPDQILWLLLQNVHAQAPPHVRLRQQRCVFFFVQDLLWVPSSFPVYLPKLQLGQLLLTCCIQAMRAA